MSGVLDGLVAVVTGGASGIGRATVLRFLGSGARVVVGDLNAANGAALLDEVPDRTRLRFLTTDVADEREVEALVGTAMESFGRLDIVFNNAGVGGAFGPITHLDVEDWDRTFSVLSRGVFLGIKHGARAMIATGAGGSIINTASAAGLVGGAGPAAYSAAKAAVVNFTYNAAVELAPHRIRVNAICPGFIHTPLMGKDASAILEKLTTFQPWPDTGQAEDIAGLALYLAGPDSTFVTGEAIRIDGGLLAAGPRMVGTSDLRPRRSRYAGFADGTTGRPPTMRPLDDPS